MLKLSNSALRSLASAPMLLAILLGSANACSQTGDDAPVAAQSPVVLKATANLVVVRVVVRDGKGDPVQGLKKEDFKLFDRGKEQTITQFEEQSSATSETSATLPERFLALYFDDLDTTEADLNQARDAADRYLKTHLQPIDRVAIFTSGSVLSDFTGDARRLHEALLKLRVSPRAISRFQDCPQLSDYQASEIVKTSLYDSDVESWKVAIDDAYKCAGNTAAPLDIVVADVRARARRVEDQTEILTRANLDGLDNAVENVSRMPGGRTVILVSPGFLSASEQAPLDRVIDRALRSQVVISSLDPKGMAVLMRESDASVANFGTGDIGPAASSLDRTRRMLASGALLEVAYGTGGEFFQNNNDLKAGFSALSGSPVYYVLAFAPGDVKQDGQFHALKVTLAGEHKGLKVQARKGYFAGPHAAESAVAELKVARTGNTPAGSPAAADPATHEMIREALFASIDTAQLDVQLDMKVGATEGETRDLSLASHLNGKDLPFRKDGDNRLNTVTFVFAVFDAKGTLLTPQQKHVDLVVPTGQMPSFFQAGINENATFQLKPGSYRLREVVIDAVGHRMTSFSRNVKIP